MQNYVFRGTDLKRIDCDNSLRIVNVSMYDMRLEGSFPDFSRLGRVTLLEMGSNLFTSLPDVFSLVAP
ncbi:hypothetical protein HDU67_009354, partial [Dinochytrium kinnereticum]